MLIIHLMPVFKRILKVNQVWQTGIISFNRFWELCQYHKSETRTASQKQDSNFLLSIKKLSYTQTDGQALISNFNMEINQPGIYRIKGENVAGKSMLFKILMGIYDLEKGEIKIGNYEYGHHPKREIKKMLGYFSNDLDFVGRSIFEMITPNRSSEFQIKVKNALNYFSLTHLAQEEKMNSPLIMSQLTNNERALLSFARLKLSNRKVLLFDNPFLNLNEQAHSIILSYFQEIKKDKIILIIDKSHLNEIEYANEFEF